MGPRDLPSVVVGRGRLGRNGEEIRVSLSKNLAFFYRPVAAIVVRLNQMGAMAGNGEIADAAVAPVILRSLLRANTRPQRISLLTFLSGGRLPQANPLASPIWRRWTRRRRAPRQNVFEVVDRHDGARRALLLSASRYLSFFHRRRFSLRRPESNTWPILRFSDKLDPSGLESLLKVDQRL
jgi:hypothetical protein